MYDLVKCLFFALSLTHFNHGAFYTKQTNFALSQLLKKTQLKLNWNEHFRMCLFTLQWIKNKPGKF